MYTKPGVTIVPDGRIIPEYCRMLIEQLPAADFETEINTALEKLGPDRTWLVGLIPYDLNKMQSPRIKPGDPLHSGLIIIVQRMLRFAGYLNEDVPLIEYRENPVLSVEEVVANMLTAQLPYPTSEDLQGDKATVLTLKSFVPQAIQRIAHLLNMRPQIYSRLRLALGNIGFKIFMNQPIDQHEKTFFMLCANTAENTPGAKLSLGKQGTPIPPLENSDPLVARDFDQLKKATEPGPGIRFKVVASNTSISNLLFYHGPLAKSLVTTVGYMIQRGPFTELNLKPLDQRNVTPMDQLTGIRDITRELGARIEPVAAAVTAATEALAQPILRTENLALKLSPPIKVCGPYGLPCLPLSMDLPNVNLHLTSEADCAKFYWSYYSLTHQAVISNSHGATEDDVYVDLAVHNPQLGEGVTSGVTLDALDTVILGESIKKRKVELNRSRITEDIHFVRDGSLIVESVDMTDYYSQLGVVQFRPDFGEFLYPPRTWLLTPDENAVTFIVAQLGLTRLHAQQSHPAIVMSHNVAVIERLTGTKSHFRLRALLEALLVTSYQIPTPL